MRRILVIAIGLILLNSPVWAALDFDDDDATDDYISVADSSSLDIGTGDLSVSVWVNMDNFTDQGNVLVKWVDAASPKAGYQFRLISTGTFRLMVGAGIDSTNRTYRTSSSAISADTWSHIAATWDSSANRILLYLNGTDVSGSYGDTNGQNDDLSNTSALDIGVDTDDSGNPIDGELMDLRIYNRELSADEIRTLANGKTTRTILDGLILHFEMNDKPSGSADTDTLLDISGTGNNGTANGNEITWTDQAILADPW